ncbi:MAG: cation transporter [Anaerolineae bacterium]
MTDKLTLLITGMDCADCALKLEKGVANLAGVEVCQVNFTTAKMELVTTLSDQTPIVQRIRALGYDVAQPQAQDIPRTATQVHQLLRHHLQYLYFDWSNFYCHCLYP